MFLPTVTFFLANTPTEELKVMDSTDGRMEISTAVCLSMDASKAKAYGKNQRLKKTQICTKVSTMMI